MPDRPAPPPDARERRSQAPAVGGTPGGGPEAALADLVRALARAAARADHEAQEAAR